MYKTDLGAEESASSSSLEETLEHVNQLATAALRLATRDSRSEEELTANLDNFQHAIGQLGLDHLVTVEAEDPVSQLTRLRHRYGLTQREVAAMMGCSNAYLSRLESGDRSSEKAIERVRTFLASGVLQTSGRPPQS